MSEISVKAFAKLNISLDVLGTLPNGYHEMRMIMQSVELCDDVSIRLVERSGIFIRTNFGFLPNDDRNIAAKAAKLFFAEAGIDGAGAEIRLKKRTPVCAGMGGGSSDAAAVLRGLNELCGTGLDRGALEKMGSKLGSDVPFCIAGGTQLAQGSGSELSPLPSMPDCFIVVCKPSFSISTPALFSQIDSRRSRIHPDTGGMIGALEAGDLKGVARRMYNVFEDVLPRRCGEISVIKHSLIDLGATGAAMSGTGSAVFGVFTDAETAENAYSSMRPRYRECFLTRPGKSIM